ncbi:LuxR family transcriptional regulator [Variovorax sp. 54]|uniref:helix-turn-helix transcriptional regulator n=1 Tax=Variovorax sp. 54 TaxID=2035212 RepID=UPI000C1A3D72|nr:LuxR family transcriptional regulator [Variovorax sp. 54]PIF73071.1 LuxR family transcriptional regulator [Variovorax sp. 54]
MILSTLFYRAPLASLSQAPQQQQDVDPAPLSDAELQCTQPIPQFYGEEQLFLPQTVQRPAGSVPSIVGDLLDAPDIEARAALVRGMLHTLDFDWLGYGAVAYMRGRWWPLSFFTAYANPEWTQRYFAHSYCGGDLRQQGVPASSVPLAWDVAQLEALAAQEPDDPGGQRQRFLDDLEASGIRSGLMFRLASPTHVNQHTVISLLSRRPGRDWITDSVIGQGLVLGLSVHEYVTRHTRIVGAPGTGRIEISATQQDILQHLLQGRSDKEIANRLDLSSHTVDYHMRQLRRRFAARNRVQLVNAVQQSDSDFGVLSEI